jgi:hypothetical protein
MKARKGRVKPTAFKPRYGSVTASQALAESLIRRVPRGKSKWSKRVNPEDIDGVVDITEEWHGRKAKDRTEIEEVERYEGSLAELADLEVLGVLGSDQATTYSINFKSDRPKVCCDKQKNQLELVGGDQELKIDGFGGKQLIPVGYCYQIVYYTDKHHLVDSDGEMASYEHFFGEEFYKENGFDVGDFKNGDDFFDAVLEEGLVQNAIEEELLPLLVYDQVNTKLQLVGGKYKIKDVGIVN